jgi:quercetin dioxygenase-like cupin family protein
MEHAVRVELLTGRGRDLETIVTYEARGASAVRLVHGVGEANAYLLHFDAGGAIGRHEAGYGQLFVVVEGRGWVSGQDDVRTDVCAGDVVLFQRGEYHDKGSDTGMTAVMVQVRDLSATRAALDVDP